MIGCSRLRRNLGAVASYLFEPFLAAEMVSCAVNFVVNSARHEGADCIHLIDLFRSQHSDTVCSWRFSKSRRCQLPGLIYPGTAWWPVRFAGHLRSSEDGPPVDLWRERQQGQPWSVPESACARTVPDTKCYATTPVNYCLSSSNFTGAGHRREGDSRFWSSHAARHRAHPLVSRDDDGVFGPRFVDPARTSKNEYLPPRPSHSGGAALVR
jgi:hypothetical protein